MFSPKIGATLLKLIYDNQLYNGKLTQTYDQAPTNECPLCHRPYSCTHFVGECPENEAHRLSRNNAAWKLVHAAIRKIAKGGGALHSAPDLVLVAAIRVHNPKL